MKEETIEFIDGKIPWSVISLSHSDLDGVVSVIVAKNLFKTVDASYVSYNNTLEPWIKSLEANPFKLNKYDMLLITDVSLKPDQIKRIFTAMQVAEFNGRFVFLDHHEGSKPIHNPGANIFVVDGVCGAKLTLGYFENIFETKLTHLHELVKYTNDYDLWKHEYPESKKLQYLLDYEMEISWKDALDTFANKYINGIDFKNLSEQQQTIISKKEKKLDEVWNDLEVSLFEDSKIAFIFNEGKYVNEMSERVLNTPELAVEVVIYIDPKTVKGSVRASDSKIKDMNLSLVLQHISKTSKFLHGDGHKLAAGFGIKDLAKDANTEQKFEMAKYAINKIGKTLISVYPNLKR